MKQAALWITVALVLAVGWASVTTASDAIGPGFYNNNLPIIQYSVFAYAADSGSYLNDMHWAACTGGASMSFSFFGSGLALYGNKNSTYTSSAQLCIDGSCVSVSFYNPTSIKQQIIASVTGLDYGTHTFGLTCNQGAGYYAIVDAVHIYPFDTLPPTQVVSIELTAEITVELTAEPTPGWRASWDGGGQDVAFEYSANAGQVADVVLQAATLLVLLLMAFVIMFRGGKPSKT